MEKQNIIYFVADQMRADTLHHLGNDASITPHLDALANEGISFKNAFCQNPVCVPSRCSFLTGTYPHTTGHRTMHFLQNPDEPNILKTMKDNGYEVIWCGRNDVIPAGRDLSVYCDEYYSGMDLESLAKAHVNSKDKEKPDTSVDGYYSFYMGENKAYTEDADTKCVKHAIEYLKKKIESNDEKPFFLYVTLMAPHPPYLCEAPFYGKTIRNNNWKRRIDLSKTTGKPSMLASIHEKQRLQNWNEDQWNELRGTYLDMVCKFDDLFGQLYSVVKASVLSENTNVFVFSDHGDYTGDYGIVEKVQNCFDDPVCNIPLIIKPSSKYTIKPRISDALVELVDLSATVASMCDINLDYTQFGHNLTHLFENEEIHREYVHCEGGRLHGETQCMELGHGETSPYWPRLSSQASEGSEHTKALMIRNHDYKYVKRLYEDDEFYDLKNDPNETHNLIHDDSYQWVIMQFKEHALSFMMETSDIVPNRKDRRY